MNVYKKITCKQKILYLIVIISCIASIIFIYNNHSLYDDPIAQVVETNIEESTEMTDVHQNEDQLFTQHIKAELKNGKEKGKIIHLTNEYSSSGAYDQKYKVGHELFVWFDKEIEEQSQLTGSIDDVKRDKYTLFVTWIFIFTLLIIGKKQGFFSIISLAVNAVLLYYALDIYVKNPGSSLVLISGITVVLFTVTSLLLVNGFNEKTYAAIISTLLGTFSALLITWFVMIVTNEKGLHYEEMQFLTRPYKLVFMAGLFIGSLGAVMDVAITMSASIFELYEKNNYISINKLKSSAFDIGKDIMGTMTNILFFAYISGAMPMLLLYMKNYSDFRFTLSMNLSLELARALAGGIGIVLTIPIGLYVSIFFIHRKKAKR